MTHTALQVSHTAMVCASSSFSISRAAAVVTLIQGVIWVILSIVGLLLYKCKIAVAINGSSSYLIYLVYFFNTKCDQAPQFLTILQSGWPLETVAAAERTLAFTATVLAFNLLWVITSIALWVSVDKTSRTQHAEFYYYFSWIVTTVIILIMDIVGLSLYGFDFIKTSTAEGLLRFLGVTQLKDDWERYMPDRYRNSPATPTAVLLPLASRIFPVLWLVDLVLLIKVICSARHLQLNTRAKFQRPPRLLANPLYRQSRWQDEAAKVHLSPAPKDQVEMQQLHDDDDDDHAETSHLQGREQDKAQDQDETQSLKDQQEQEKHNLKNQTEKDKKQQAIHHEQRDVPPLQDISAIASNSEPPLMTSSPESVRSSVLSRLSTSSQATPALRNQLPWSYLGRPSSNGSPLAMRASTLKSNEAG